MIRVIYNQDKTVRIIRATSQDSEEIIKAFDKATPDGSEYDDLESSDLPDQSKERFWRGSKAEGVYIDQDLVDAYSLNNDRKLAISEEENTSGLKDKTPQEIKDMVEAFFEPATTIAALKAKVIAFNKKIACRLLIK